MSPRGPFVKGLVPKVALLEDSRTSRKCVLVEGRQVIGGMLGRGLWHSGPILNLLCLPGHEVSGIALLHTPAVMFSFPQAKHNGAIHHGLESPNYELK